MVRAKLTKVRDAGGFSALKFNSISIGRDILIRPLRMGGHGNNPLARSPSIYLRRQACHRGRNRL